MKFLLKLFIMISILMSCHDESPEEIDDNSTPPDPAYTAVGVPVGVVTTKNIGTSGGTISSEDNRFEIEIPAGALNSDTPISIQAITNEAPGGVGLAYRFHPENLKLSKPAVLKFHYTQEELAGSAVQLMGITFQANDRTWRTTYEFEFDEFSQTIFATTSHFTDFAAYERYKLIIPADYQDTIDTEESTILHLMTNYERYQEDNETFLPPLPRGSLDGQDDLPPLPVWHLSVLQQVQWLVNGRSNPVDGRIVDGGTTSHTPTIAAYTAPNEEPPFNPVHITATISGVVNRRDRLILGANVYVKTEYNFTLFIESTEDNMCGYVDSYKYSADMDIHVKNDIVTISNVVNHLATLADPTAELDGGCTMTYERGMVDYGRILEATGEVENGAPGESKTLVVTLRHTSGNTTCFLKCPEYNTRTPLNSSEFEIKWTFALKDAPQEWHDPSRYYHSKLTPR